MGRVGGGGLGLRDGGRAGEQGGASNAAQQYLIEHKKESPPLRGAQPLAEGVDFGKTVSMNDPSER
jgi:hypothetical protein